MEASESSGSYAAHPGGSDAASDIQPPYRVIARALSRGNVVPFLGAGASLAARDSHEKFDPHAPNVLPSGVELAKYLAHEASFPAGEDCTDLAAVSSYFADVVSDRATLRDCLREVFGRHYQPGPLHKLLASVPSPMVIVTTNYDQLLEQAFEEVGKPYDLVVYPAEQKAFVGALWWPHGADEPQRSAANELDLDLSKTTVIFKIHGTISAKDAKWDSYVITEEDYIEFLSRMTTNSAIPSLFATHFSQRSFLFLGYSLRDWNLRVLLKNMSKSLAQRVGDSDAPRSWAIQSNPSPLQKRLWERKGVTIFNMQIDKFVEQLGADMPPPRA